jgi:uncharacterized repeat protein (TIGR01451 family)
MDRFCVVRWARCVGLICLTTLASCAQVRVPAFDPTGQSIFSGNSTALAPFDGPIARWHREKHARNQAEAGIAAAPASAPCATAPLVAGPPAMAPAPAPLMVQPCGVPLAPPVAPPSTCQPRELPPPPASSFAPSCNNPQGSMPKVPQLLISPQRIVAPVCSEVVVAAGICGPEGYYITRRPIEWMVAQDGVGQIVAVGKESPLGVSHLLRGSPDKLGTNFVLAHTSTISQCIDKGTPDPSDDVNLSKGQSWISVTSPTEGTSYVTVVAPKEHLWETRRATATIYWVDAKWTLPSCRFARAGEKQSLVTVVTRKSGEPVVGWTVRYEVLEGPEADVGSVGRKTIDVQTNARGEAIAELLPRSVTPGITTVGVQIIRPQSSRGDVPQMVVGQGVASVRWSAPGLVVYSVGPSTVEADGAISYRVEVANTGDVPSQGVTLSYTPPPGLTVLNSNPTGQPFGQRLEWRLGDIPPGAAAAVEINCRATRAADIRSTFNARNSAGLTAESSVSTRIVASALSLVMTGPESVEVGGTAQFRVEVTNTSSSPLTNVTVTDNFPPGLAHTAREPSPIVRALGTLEPGQTQRFAVSFVVLQPGQHCHRLDVIADNTTGASTRGCVTGVAAVAAPPTLNLRIDGPSALEVDQAGSYSVDVSNTGSSKATGVIVRLEFAPSLAPREATGARVDQPGQPGLAWQLAEINPGETVRLRVNCQALTADARALLKVSVQSRETVTKIEEYGTRIIARAPAAPPPPREAPAPELPERPAPAIPAEPAAAGNLRVTIAETADPIQEGRNTTYLIVLRNERTVADRDVTLTLVASEGLKIVGIAGPTREVGVTPDGRQAELAPIAEMRAGEQLPAYRIEVQGTRPGRQRFRVLVQSARDTAGQTIEVETTVNMAGGLGP